MSIRRLASGRRSSFGPRLLVAVALLVAALAASAPARGAGVFGDVTETPAASPPAGDEPCATGRLRIADLNTADAVWAIAIAADRDLAAEWQDDAALVSADVTCEFLTPEIRVRTVFYSATARSRYEPETGRAQPLDPGVPDPRELPAPEVSFSLLADVLIEEGFDPSDEIGPAGITIQLNTDSARFGPDAIPLESTVMHLTLGDGLDARDLYVTDDGTVYRYDDEEET